MPHTLLMYDYFVTSREGFLRDHLTTEWEILLAPEPRDADRVRTALVKADALVGFSFPAELAGTAPRLRLIHCVGAGVDKIDKAAMPPGCTLCNVYEHEIPLAEYTIAAMLMMTLRLDYYAASFREGRWDGSGRHDGEFHGEVFGRTLGLIGFGHVGREVAVRAKALGMRVIAVTRSPKPHPDLAWCGGRDRLPELMSTADVVVIACPIDDSTRGMIGAAELRLMKPTGLLINPARAEVIDEQALFTVLKERRIGGAALDAWYQYPPRIDEIMHGSRLPFHELDNVIGTPHSSAWTEPMLRRRYRGIAANLDRFARGEPLERIVYVAPPPGGTSGGTS